MFVAAYFNLAHPVTSRVCSAVVLMCFVYFSVQDFLSFYETSIFFFGFRGAFLLAIGGIYAFRVYQPAPSNAPLTSRLVAVVHALFPALIVLQNAETQIGVASFLGVITGLTVSALGLVDLGNSFGISPANRGIRTDGLYGLVRHPMYLGYLISFAAICFAIASIYNLIVLGAFIGFTLARIHLEELVLGRDSAYCDYTKRVQYRLIPGVV